MYEECIAGSCSCVHVIGSTKAQLRPCRVGHFLFSDNCCLDSEVVNKIWDGVCDGFHIVDEGQIPSYECDNYQSILSETFRKEMSSILESDLIEGRIGIATEKPHCVHSLGGVEKSNGRLRPITDCSMPDKISINNYMSTTCDKFSYNSVDSLAQLISKGDFMGVTDIASAFRSVSIHPDDYKYQGFSWEVGEEKVYYEDYRLCFGLKCAPFKFDLLSQLVVDMARAEGISRIVNYLDDFAIVEDSLEKCKAAQLKLVRILRKIGFNIAWQKLETPSTHVKFLGIILDSEEMNLSLPMCKLEKLLESMDSKEKAGSATKKELERVAGLMAHCSTVIKGGRTFSRRVYDLCVSLPRHGRSKLSEELQLDLEWWKNFCKMFNGSAKIIPHHSSVSIISDASFWVFGAWCDSDWFFGQWGSIENTPLDVHDHRVDPPVYSVVNPNINTLELWPVLLGMRRWAQSNRCSTIELVTDNSQVIYMINTGRSQNKRCMGWIREIFWTCFIYNINVFASYIRTENNMLADSLSRLDSNSKFQEAMALLTSNSMCCTNLLCRANTGGDQEESRSVRARLGSSINKLSKGVTKEEIL